MSSIDPAVSSDTSPRVRKSSNGKNKASHPNGTQMIMRWVGQPLEERIKIETAGAVQGIWKRFVASCDWFDHSKESVIVVAMNTRMEFTGWHLVSTGSLNSCYLEPREVLRAALCIDAWGIVLMHNHPSGAVSPSRADVRITRLIADSCRVVGVDLFDHVIVDSWGTNAYSFRASFGESFACPGGMDSGLVPPPPKTPVAPSADPVRADAIKSIGAGVKVKIRLPSAFLRRNSVESLQQALFAYVQQETMAGWVRRWTAARGLQKHLRRMRSFKFQREKEFVFAEADFERLKAAAGAINEAPETLLAALAGEVEESFATWKKVEGHRNPPDVPPEKILQFIR